jgi:flagellar hook-associated protein FlgK
MKKKFADHIVARVSGVTQNDSRIEAANKAIATMKEFGFPAKDIRKAEAMRDAAIARGVT